MVLMVMINKLFSNISYNISVVFLILLLSLFKSCEPSHQRMYFLGLNTLMKSRFGVESMTMEAG